LALRARIGSPLEVNQSAAIYSWLPVFGNLDAAAPNSAPLTSGLSAARTVYRSGRKYEIFAAVHGLASANPIGACERHCEKVDAGELAPPIRSRRPSCGLCGPETWTWE
jgi:hypothetical protein